MGCGGGSPDLPGLGRAAQGGGSGALTQKRKANREDAEAANLRDILLRLMEDPAGPWSLRVGLLRDAASTPFSMDGRGLRGAAAPGKGIGL